MSFADVNGIKIYYEIHGEGEAIILVHGFGAKHTSWIAQVPELSKHYKVIIFDNRGAGKSERPDQKYSMETFADDIAGLMNFLGIEKAKAVGGWSLGGMIVQHFLLKYQERVEKSFLLLTNYRGAGGEMYTNSQLEGVDARKGDYVKEWWAGAKAGYYIKFRKQMEADPKKKHYGIWSAEDLIEDWITDPPTHNDIKHQGEALEMHNTLKRLHEIKVPILLIAGSHDRLTPKTSMQEMHDELPNSEFHIIEKAGHAAPQSRAPEVNEHIMNFLKK